MKTIRFFLILIAVFLIGTVLCFSKPGKAPAADNSSKPSPSPKLTPIPEIQEPFLPPPKKRAGPLLSLDECLQTAFMKHPDILFRRAAVDAQEARLQQVYALYIPTINVTVNDTYQKVTPANPIPSIAQSQLNASYTLWDSKQRAEKLNSARENLMAALLNLKSTWIDKVDEVRETYYGVVFEEWLLIIQEDGLAKAIENLRVANGFYQAGAKSKIDVTQAEIETERSQVQLARVKTELLNAKVKLAKAVGIDVSEITDRQLENILEQEMVLPDKNEAVSQMEKSHPSLLTFLAQEKGAMALAKAFENQVLPTIAAQASYGVLGQIIPNSVAWNIGATLTIPLSAGKAAKSQADEQKSLAGQFYQQKEIQKLTLIRNIDSAYSDIQGAKDRTEAATRQVKSAVLNFTLAYKRYKQGVSTIIELNSARDYLNNARNDYVLALYDRKVAEARLVQAIGLPGFPVISTQQQQNPVQEKK
ncbi:MAG: TolC family protein [Firmicutes bacterium]|nr:TolC family protein [Bacillota bacterium]